MHSYLVQDSELVEAGRRFWASQLEARDLLTERLSLIQDDEIRGGSGRIGTEYRLTVFRISDESATCLCDTEGHEFILDVRDSTIESLEDKVSGRPSPRNEEKLTSIADSIAVSPPSTATQCGLELDETGFSWKVWDDYYQHAGQSSWQIEERPTVDAGCLTIGSPPTAEQREVDLVATGSSWNVWDEYHKNAGQPSWQTQENPGVIADSLPNDLPPTAIRSEMNSEAVGFSWDAWDGYYS